MKIEETISFLRNMFVNMVDLAAHAVKGSETEESAVTCMQHLETAITALEKQKEVIHCNDCKLKDECEKKINGHYYPPDSYTAVNWCIEGITYCSGGSRV